MCRLQALHRARRAAHSSIDMDVRKSATFQRGPDGEFSLLRLCAEVMKFYGSGEDLAKDMGVPLSVIEQAHEEHFQAAKKTETDPDGGPYPAYPSGKCWDEAGQERERETSLSH